MFAPFPLAHALSPAPLFPCLFILFRRLRCLAFEISVKRRIFVAQTFHTLFLCRLFHFAFCVVLFIGKDLLNKSCISRNTLWINRFWTFYLLIACLTISTKYISKLLYIQTFVLAPSLSWLSFIQTNTKATMHFGSMMKTLFFSNIICVIIEGDA